MKNIKQNIKNIKNHDIKDHEITVRIVNIHHSEHQINHRFICY